MCCLATQPKLLLPSVLQSSPFIAEGFGSWNKALERFDMHERSQIHCGAVERLSCEAFNIDIDVLMSAQSSTEQEVHKSKLFK